MRTTAGSEPDRTLSLLWRHHLPQPRSSGPRQHLTVDDVVAAGTGIADSVGLAGLSMRRVAGRLAVRPMSLYTYVPGRSELLELMADAAYGELAKTAHGRKGWRRRLETVARDRLALYLRHPWLVQVDVSRPVLGPLTIAAYEHELGAVGGIGLEDVEMDSVLTVVLDFARAAARSIADRATAAEMSGIDDEAWWAANEPVLSQVFDPERFPLAARVGTAAGEAHRAAHDPEHAFEFGLARVLDGIAVLVQQRR